MGHTNTFQFSGLQIQEEAATTSSAVELEVLEVVEVLEVLPRVQQILSLGFTPRAIWFGTGFSVACA